MKTKKLLSSFLVIALLLTMIPVAVFAGSPQTSVHIHVGSGSGIIDVPASSPAVAGYLLVNGAILQINNNPDVDLNQSPFIPFSSNTQLGISYTNALWATISVQVSPPYPTVPATTMSDLYWIPMHKQGNSVITYDFSADIGEAVYGAVLFVDPTFTYFPIETYAPAGSTGLEIGVEANGTINYWMGTPPAVVVVKLDDTTRLQGAVFSLFSTNNQDNNRQLISSGLTTDQNGEILIGELDNGYYVLVETTAPAGFSLPNGAGAETHFRINNGTNFPLVVEIQNARLSYPIAITKLDTAIQQGLQGAVFGLYSDAAATVLIDSQTTDADGEATFDAQLPGTYYIKEITAPSGFVLDPTIHTVTLVVGNNGNATLQVPAFGNARTPYPIVITKIDPLNEQGSQGLAGAIFGLYSDAAATVLIDSQSTDADGKATFTAQLPGTYYIKEITAPVGYKLSSVIHEITIVIGNAGNEVFEVPAIENDRVDVPSVSLVKQVRNLTLNGIFSDLTSLPLPGQAAQFSILVTNTGNTQLVNLVLTDNQAAIGTPVTIGGNPGAWADNGDGKVKLDLPDLAVDESVLIVYDYTSVPADADSTIVNTAAVSGSNPAGGDPVTANDSATVEVGSIPLVVPGISLVKQVSNLTQGGAPADLALGVPGNLFRYYVTITNTGLTNLTNLRLTDNRAVAGSTIKNVTDNTTTTWLADGSNPVFILLDDLAPGESVSFTYDFTSTPADNGDTLVNTAKVSATAVKINDISEIDGDIILSAQDSATVILDEIPLTGENDTQTGIGLGLLIGGAALVLFRRRRHLDDAVPTEDAD